MVVVSSSKSIRAKRMVRGAARRTEFKTLLPRERKMAAPPDGFVFTKAHMAAFGRGYEAVWRGATRDLEKVLDSGMNVDGSAPMGFHPLLMAASLERMPEAELLIARGADVNLPFRVDLLDPGRESGNPHAHGERPLHGAAKYCNIDIVMLLLRAGADVNATDIDGRTPLHDAFFKVGQIKSPQHHYDIAKVLLSAGADPRLADRFGSIPLQFAAGCGDIATINLLLSSAPETLNRPSREGWTALGYAAISGHAMATTRLLAVGASALGCLPGCILTQAIMKTDEEVVRAIIENTDEVSRIPFAFRAPSVAVFIGHARILHHVLHHVLEEDGKDIKTFLARTVYVDTGIPLLHFAAGHGILPSVRVLLAAGALEADTDAGGRRACDVVGTMDSKKFARENVPVMTVEDGDSAEGFLQRTILQRFRDRDSKSCAAIRRLLEQGPAFRSHSWGWPTGRAAAPRAGNRERAPRSSSSGVKTISPMPVVRIFRPKQTASFADTIGR